MTRDDIIRMAREAGLQEVVEKTDHHTIVKMMDVPALERFAALVAAAERQRVAAWMLERSYATGHGDTTEDLLKELEWQVRESEREACAKLCEQWEWANNAADAIRARGQQ